MPLFIVTITRSLFEQPSNSRSVNCCASFSCSGQDRCGRFLRGSTTSFFSDSDGTHFKQRIWPDNQDNSATIDDVFSRLPAGCPVFVKMDIEGSEYLVLDDLLRHSQNIVAMAIEFHDVDTHPDLFNSLRREDQARLLYRTHSRQQHGRHRAIQFSECSGNYIPPQAVFRLPLRHRRLRNIRSLDLTVPIILGFQNSHSNFDRVTSDAAHALPQLSQ